MIIFIHWLPSWCYMLQFFAELFSQSHNHLIHKELRRIQISYLISDYLLHMFQITIWYFNQFNLQWLTPAEGILAVSGDIKVMSTGTWSLLQWVIQKNLTLKELKSIIAHVRKVIFRSEFIDTGSILKTRYFRLVCIYNVLIVPN